MNNALATHALAAHVQTETEIETPNTDAILAPRFSQVHMPWNGGVIEFHKGEKEPWKFIKPEGTPSACGCFSNAPAENLSFATMEAAMRYTAIDFSDSQYIQLRDIERAGGLAN